MIQSELVKSRNFTDNEYRQWPKKKLPACWYLFCFCYIICGQMIRCNTNMKTMVKYEQPCSSGIFAAALVSFLSSFVAKPSKSIFTNCNKNKMNCQQSLSLPFQQPPAALVGDHVWKAITAITAKLTLTRTNATRKVSAATAIMIVAIGRTKTDASSNHQA